MKKDHILSILITFTVGLVAGSYLYFTQFLPNFSPEAISESIMTDTLVIEGEMYGGFRTGSPPSFQLENGGVFRYLPIAPGNSVADVRTGVLPQEIWSAVERSVSETALVTAAEVRERTDCQSYVDGIDYRYSIRINEEVYMLDSCTTAFTTTGTIGQTMASVWDYLETIE